MMQAFVTEPTILRYFMLKTSFSINAFYGCFSVVQFICMVNIFAVDINSVDVAPSIDGSLEEWGGIRMIDLNPSNRGVGLRGSFDGISDHWAGVLLSWDADSLYAGVTVVDNVCDIQRVNVGENVWKGPNGEKENKMFYFDHFKLFLRDTEKPLGFNVWVKPSCKDSGVYVWGGQQRGAATDDLPIRVASKAMGQTYSYELAIPWSWLQIDPFSNMNLKGLFLLTDADNPGIELRKKVRLGSKWIWWEGKLTMRGMPSGLPKETKEEMVSKNISRESVSTDFSSKSYRAETPKKRELEKSSVNSYERKNQVEKVERVNSQISDKIVKKTVFDSTSIDVDESGVVSSSTSQLRMQLQRKLALGQQFLTAPDWVYDKTQKTKLRRSQIDTLYHRLRENLRRIITKNINSRSDGIISDLADFSGLWRSDARGFVLIILEDILHEMKARNSRLKPTLSAWAVSCGIDISKLEIFIEEVCMITIRAYRKEKVVVSGDVFKKARQKSGLSEEHGQQILSLVADCL